MRLSSEIIEARSAHLTPVEKRLAWTRLSVRPEDVEGPPVGLLVGEQPPQQMGTCLPLFPYPGSSSAGRLLRISGMTPGVYLGRFFRRNLFDEYRAWSAPAAREAAEKIREWLRTLGNLRVLLMGQKVGAAFGLDGFFAKREEFYPDDEGGYTHEFVAIPHPSGNNRLYNEHKIVDGARAAMMWAAGLT